MDVISEEVFVGGDVKSDDADVVLIWQYYLVLMMLSHLVLLF